MGYTQEICHRFSTEDNPEDPVLFRPAYLTIISGLFAESDPVIYKKQDLQDL